MEHGILLGFQTEAVSKTEKKNLIVAASSLSLCTASILRYHSLVLLDPTCDEQIFCANCNYCVLDYFVFTLKYCAFSESASFEKKQQSYLAAMAEGAKHSR